MLKTFVSLGLLLASAGFASAQIAGNGGAVAVIGNSTQFVFRPNEAIETVKILSKPEAAYADRSACIRGSVALRVTFQADGSIGKISVIAGLPYGFTESAIAAARKIKFIPAKLNGIPVTSTRTIQYSFSGF